MKQMIVGLSGAFFFFAAASASAQDRDAPPRTDFYGSIGYTHVLANETLEFRNVTKGYKLGLGAVTARFGAQAGSPAGWHFGLEAQGSIGIKHDRETLAFPISNPAGNVQFNVKEALKREFSGYLTVTTPPVGGNVELIARAGGGSTRIRADYTVRFNGGNPSLSAETVTQGFLAAGVGAQIFFNRTNGARLDYTHLFYGKRPEPKSYLADQNAFTISYVLRF